MKKILMMATMVFACVAMAQGTAEGRGFRRGPGGHGFGPGMAGAGGDPAVMAVMNPNVAKKIGLSDELRAKIREAGSASRDEIDAKQKKMRECMDRQAELMKAPKIDEAAVMAVVDELFNVRRDMAKLQVKRIIAVKALLTPQQLAAALEEVKRMREERRNARAEGKVGEPRGPRHRGPRGNRQEKDAAPAPEK